LRNAALADISSNGLLVRIAAPNVPLLVVSAWLAVASVAIARPREGEIGAGALLTTLRLSWSRGPGAGSCLNQSELSARVRARLGRDPFSEQARLEIQGRVIRNGERLQVEIGVRDESGNTAGRRVIESASQDCGPLGDAIVLAVALAIDPDAKLDAVTPSEAAFPSSVVSTAPPPVPVQLAVSPARVEPSAPSVVARAAAKHVELMAVARALVAFGALPAPAAGAELEASAGRGTLRGSLALAYLPEKSSADPRIALGLTFATAGACYDPVLGRVARFRLCGGVQVGAIHAVARQVYPGNPGDQLWLAAALAPHFVWTPLAPLTFDAGISAVVPLFRREFGVAGDTSPAFREAPVGVMAALGAGLRVP
jgi:hypothetical protein